MEDRKGLYVGLSTKGLECRVWGFKVWGLRAYD